MENRVVINLSPINPLTGEESEEELFVYRYNLLHWGVVTNIDREYGVAITNTVAVVEAIDLDANGYNKIMLFSPEELSFE